MAPVRLFALAGALALSTACSVHRVRPAAPPPPPPAPVAMGAADRPAADAVTVALSTSATLQDMLVGIEAAYRAGRYGDGLSLVKRTLETSRKDLSVYDRVGSVYYLLGRYGEALAVWEQALMLEKRPRRKRELHDSIVMARRTLGLPEPPGMEPPPPPRPKPAPSKKRPDPKAVEKLYDQGVAHYAKGEYLQAASAFYQALELDPEHALAKSALARLKLKPGVVDAEPGSNRSPGTAPEENGIGARKNGD